MPDFRRLPRWVACCECQRVTTTMYVVPLYHRDPKGRVSGGWSGLACEEHRALQADVQPDKGDEWCRFIVRSVVLRCAGQAREPSARTDVGEMTFDCKVKNDIPKARPIPDPTRVLAVLRKVQFASSVNGSSNCPVCGNWVGSGHAPGCELAALIAEYEALT